MLQESLTRQVQPVDGSAEGPWGPTDAEQTEQTEQPRPWRQAAIAAAVVWVGSHLGYLVVNLLAWRVGGLPDPERLLTMLSAWYRWDTGHYVRIADYGYGVNEIDRAFFPLYPVLIRGASYILPGSTALAALVLSNVACLGALVMIHRLTAKEFGSSIADRTIYFFIAFPTAFFMSAPYNTSLFVLLAAGFLYLIRSGHWWWAAVLGGLATATRSSGVLLALPFLYEYLRQRDFQIRRIRFDVLAVGGIFGGLAAFTAYCWYRFGDPLAYVHAQHFWGRTFRWPWQSIYDTFEQIIINPKMSHYQLTNLQDLWAALLVLTLLTLAVVGPWKFRRDQLYLVLFGFAVALFPLFNGTSFGEGRPIISTSRHLLEVVPAFMVLARIGTNRYVERIYVPAAVMAQAVLLAIFLHYDWVA